MAYSQTTREGRVKKQKTEADLLPFFVRAKGLEPPRLSALDPKSSAATNYATSAIRGAKIVFFSI